VLVGASVLVSSTSTSLYAVSSGLVASLNTTKRGKRWTTTIDRIIPFPWGPTFMKTF